ncbi:hypothetical protein [Acetobacter oeni]|nr:hypothetical protein [Acetobacter oeni]MBB3881790.1 hypothetical protein [Acetobacter oeni]NHO17408.1 hypothetical protein [Acetobacter oeni]
MSVLNLPFAIYLTIINASTTHFWLVETPLAVVGSVLLSVSLLTECACLRAEKYQKYQPLQYARPYWTTGLVIVAVFLADPFLKIATLLLASILSVVMTDRGQGRAVTGWMALRVKASGALLVLAGLLFPGPASGLLAGAGYAVLGGLFPVTAFPVENCDQKPADVRTVCATFRTAAGALLVAGSLAMHPLSVDGGIIFSTVFIGFGFVTLFVTTLRMQFLTPGYTVRWRQGYNLTQACLALAAVAAGLELPEVVCLALTAPTLTLPWFMSGKTKSDSVRTMRTVERLACLLPFVTVLIILYVMAPRSVAMMLALTIIVLPAIRRVGRDLLPTETT